MLLELGRRREGCAPGERQAFAGAGRQDERHVDLVRAVVQPPTERHHERHPRPRRQRRRTRIVKRVLAEEKRLDRPGFSRRDLVDHHRDHPLRRERLAAPGERAGAADQRHPFRRAETLPAAIERLVREPFGQHRERRARRDRAPDDVPRADVCRRDDRAVFSSELDRRRSPRREDHVVRQRARRTTLGPEQLAQRSAERAIDGGRQRSIEPRPREVRLYVATTQPHDRRRQPPHGHAHRAQRPPRQAGDERADAGYERPRHAIERALAEVALRHPLR